MEDGQATLILKVNSATEGGDRRELIIFGFDKFNLIVIT